MKISFHTDAFNTSFVSFDRCLEWARDHDVHWIECEGQGGPMLTRSLEWLRRVLCELGIPEETN
ncbi:MAG: hypothetical protein KA004_14505 [Verrucomicrobiales bacterium]|nr:hypothetical protein [Verrucomicrobiales bacterium]